MRYKICTSIIVKYQFWFKLPIGRILDLILQEMNLKWLKKSITTCQMTQCMTCCSYNMLSCCISNIWKSKAILQNSTLFGAMDAVVNSNLQKLGTLVFNTLLWKFLMTYQLVVKSFGTFLLLAMEKVRWMALKLYWKEKSGRNTSNVKEKNCRMQMKLLGF